MESYSKRANSKRPFRSRRSHPTVLPPADEPPTHATPSALQTYQDVRPSNKSSRRGGSSSDKNGSSSNNNSRFADLLLPHNPPPLSNRSPRAHARRPRGPGPPPPLPDRLPPHRAAVRGHDHEGEGAGPRRGGGPPAERRGAARREDARPGFLGREEGWC